MEQIKNLTNAQQATQLKVIKFNYIAGRNIYEAVCPYCQIRRRIELIDIKLGDEYECPVCAQKSKIHYKF